MRKLILFIIVVAFLAGPVLAVPTNGAGYYGGRVNYGRISGYFSGGGGEFTLKENTTGSLLLSNAAYSYKTRGQDGNAESFQTFCVELGEYVAQPMDIWVSTANVDGTAGSHAWYGGGAGDDLDARTAYLYTQFAKGVLSNYNYTAGAGRKGSAGELQEAIWNIEGESSAADGQALTWITEASDAITAGTWSGIGNVRILQTYLGTNRKQDQLYLQIPAPGAVLLGSLGVGLVGWLRRKRCL